MTSHELAKILLTMDDKPVTTPVRMVDGWSNEEIVMVNISDDKKTIVLQ